MQPTQKTSEAVSQNTQEIMNRWEARAQKEVAATFGQPSLILRNSLPDLLQSLAILLSTQKRTALQIGIDAAELLKISKEHGRGRAEIPAYVLSQVIAEYHILREVLFQYLKENCEFPIPERELLTSAIEEAVNVAATEFSLTMREIQDQFMLSIAHDLKNPITVVQAGAELIRRTPHSPRTIPLAEKMINSMQKMSDMIEDIHDTSRIEAGQKLLMNFSECDVDAIVRDVISDMQLVYGDHFILSSEGRNMGLWNPEYLRRLIENLVSNAVKYRAPETPVSVHLRQNEQEALFEIQNQGDAIPTGNLVNLFNGLRWKASGRSAKGWGLGLVLVKGIVDALGGSIQATSTPTEGTTITLILPKRAALSEPKGLTAREAS